jgi:hypothetical protein
MIHDLKKDSNKETNEVSKSIQDLDKELSNKEEKFIRKLKLWKKK